MDKSEPMIKKEIDKTCFIITPVGDENSETRRFADGVIDACIIPVLSELNIIEEVPHRLVSSGSITKEIIDKLINCDLVIANLTKLNPNVMYELGIRHAARKPVVHICEEGTILPFDIAPERTLCYVNDMKGVEDFKPKLKEFIEAAMDGKTVNNPVYDAIQLKNIMQDVKQDEPLSYILHELNSIKKYLFSNTEREGTRQINLFNNKLRQNKINVSDYEFRLNIKNKEKNDVEEYYGKMFFKFMAANSMEVFSASFVYNEKKGELIINCNFHNDINDVAIKTAIDAFINKYED
jgi:hypothetical protein